MKEMGIVDNGVSLSAGLPNIPAWEKLTPEQQKLSARRMEIYAAMLANMDFHIGRVLDRLKELGKLDNTLVVFLSDNGPEPIELAHLVETVFKPEAKTRSEKLRRPSPAPVSQLGNISLADCMSRCARTTRSPTCGKKQQEPAKVARKKCAEIRK